MGRFDAYKIDLKSLSAGTHPYEFALDNKFFTDIDGAEVQKGKVKVSLTVKRASAMFEMTFRMEGTVWAPCDRCLDDMELPVETSNRLIVKFGKEYAEESDEIVIIPADEGAINLAWFLYEFVALAIPMKHIHPPGKCNKSMTSKLKRHAAKSADDEDDEYNGADEATDDEMLDETIDPRWDALQGLIENDND
ncbi:MAG: DUF177 domain-containing protein [Bacteroidales bacterium]